MHGVIRNFIDHHYCTWSNIHFLTSNANVFFLWFTFFGLIKRHFGIDSIDTFRADHICKSLESHIVHLASKQVILEVSKPSLSNLLCHPKKLPKIICPISPKLQEFNRILLFEQVVPAVIIVQHSIWRPFQRCFDVLKRLSCADYRNDPESNEQGKQKRRDINRCGQIERGHDRTILSIRLRWERSQSPFVFA